MKRITNDFYETPKKLTEILLAQEPGIKGNILEPCAGNGAIAQFLSDQQYQVTATDIAEDSKNDATKKEYWENLDFPVHWTITNPPFKQATEILQLALKHSENVAMLLRLTFLEPCVNRADLLNDHADKLTQLISVNPRPKFRKDTNKTDSVTVAWFVWKSHWSWAEQGIDCPFRFQRYR